MPKKPPKNAFFFFMLYVKQKEEARGRRFVNGMADVSAVASELWNQLSPEERAPYEMQAKDAKASPPGAHGERYTSQGIAFSEIDRANAAAKLAEENMHKEINQIVKKSFQNNTISTQEYIFVAGNYFCKTHDNVYVPAELALVKYNASEGYGNKYHVFVDPVELPSGYSFEGTVRSKNVHRLPPPPKAFGEKNYSTILLDILTFFGTNSSRNLPPMFTDTVQVPVIRSIIEQLCEGTKEDPSNFRVYPIAQLFFVLKGEASKYALDGKGAFQSVHIAQTMIDRDQYDYRSNLACTYHEEIDASKYCSLSYVIRWSFIISDHICSDLGITMIPGRHVPSDSDITHKGAEPKDDLDDCQSTISAVPSHASNLTASTAYTQWNNDGDSIAASGIANTEDNFPTIGGRDANQSSVSRAAHESQQSPPWFDRGQAVREPLDTSLSFAVGGRGRGFNTVKSPDSHRSMGRGRFN